MSNSRKTSNLFMVLALTVMVLCLSAGPATARKTHVRDGWLVGLSYGYSQGHISWSGEPQGSYKGGAIPQIRFGRMVSSKLALGLEYHGWMLEQGIVPVKIRSSLQSATLAATWYPGGAGSAWEGFYLRGGAGYAWAGLSFVEIDEEPPEHVPLEQEHGTRYDESGLGLNVQMGYEFRVSRSFAGGIGMGFDYLSIDKTIYKSSYYFPVTLTAVWYWD
ncbi:MAG: hypothetical protein ABFS42_02665 [Candidatus Krumholzibacteriota bacterium]